MLKDMAMRLAGRLEPLLSGTTSDDMPKHCMRRGWELFESGLIAHCWATPKS